MMARSHARLSASIWSDPEWCDLTAGAQRAYMLLLSQPKLTLAGSLDLLPRRWAGLARDVTPDAMRAALSELQDAGFIECDHETTELVIRTFARHDFTPGGFNKNIAKGFWTAWAAIQSARLRHTVVAHLPDFVWDKSEAPAAAKALKSREWTRFEPETQSRFEPQDELRSEPYRQPSTVDRLPSLLRDVTETDAAADPAAAAIDQAVDLVMAARHRNGAPAHVNNPGGWLAAARKGIRSEVARLAAQNPDWPPQHLADALAPVRVPVSLEDEFLPAAHPPPAGPAFDRAAHADCTECDGHGDVRNENDEWVRQCTAKDGAGGGVTPCPGQAA